VAIAAFDPQAARYVTKVTPRLPIRVGEVPKFDPATLDYPTPPAQATPSRSLAPAGRAAAALTLGIVTTLLAAFVARRVHLSRTGDPRRLLLRRARELDARQGAEATARRITDTLAEYLERTSGRPWGVLTPEEARSALAQAAPGVDLGARGARLVAHCDRACYSGHELDTAALVAEARQLFEEIGRKKSR
jgi:hypothetical protein